MPFKIFFSQYFGSLQDAESFKYKESKKCLLEFSAVQENQPSKRYRLAEVLAGKVSLPRIELSISEIEKEILSLYGPDFCVAPPKLPWNQHSSIRKC